MSSGSVSWRIKSFYGLGQAAESIKNFGFGTLLLLYYNQVLGLSGTYSGIAVFIAVALKVFWPYDVNRRRHGEIRAALDAKRSAETGDGLLAD
ncbi:MAG: MFS transporter [Kiritimatiellia bacterium]|jgi:hypothetical protein|nr:MFS transporter [Pseudomonadales bacterium]MDP6472593.1 MFS transporter [Pseudomonadales bacterium]MDP6829264.1 MFS transporter [Pseudomonadales bacterium]MDP7022788.1 MFS transporter [Kiritimatiellia bacterium]|tara:strand:- start:618 stop:896 length:279 start_codon:yes stop_codon:yes gene_type:complete